MLRCLHKWQFRNYSRKVNDLESSFAFGYRSVWHFPSRIVKVPEYRHWSNVAEAQSSKGELQAGMGLMYDVVHEFQRIECPLKHRHYRFLKLDAWQNGISQASRLVELLEIYVKAEGEVTDEERAHIEELYEESQLYKERHLNRQKEQTAYAQQWVDS